MASVHRSLKRKNTAVITLSKAIDEHLEITTDTDEVTDYIADFIRAGVKSGDAEALVIFLMPAITMFTTNRHAGFTRKIRIAAAESVDGFGGQSTFEDASGVIIEVTRPGALDKAVLADTFKIGPFIVSIGDMDVGQHQEMIDRYQSYIGGLQTRVDDHTEWIQMITVAGATRLNDLI